MKDGTKLTKEIAELKEELNKIKGELTCPFCGGKVVSVESMLKKKKRI